MGVPALEACTRHKADTILVTVLAAVFPMDLCCQEEDAPL